MNAPTPNATSNEKDRNWLRYLLRTSAEQAGVETTVGVVNKIVDALQDVMREEGVVLVRLGEFEEDMASGGLDA